MNAKTYQLYRMPTRKCYALRKRRLELDGVSIHQLRDHLQAGAVMVESGFAGQSAFLVGDNKFVAREKPGL